MLSIYFEHFFFWFIIGFFLVFFSYKWLSFSTKTAKIEVFIIGFGSILILFMGAFFIKSPNLSEKTLAYASVKSLSLKDIKQITFTTDSKFPIQFGIIDSSEIKSILNAIKFNSEFFIGNAKGDHEYWIMQIETTKDKIFSYEISYSKEQLLINQMVDGHPIGRQQNDYLKWIFTEFKIQNNIK